LCPLTLDASLQQIEGQVRAAVRDALHRSTRKPLQWGGLAGYQQLVAIEEVLRQVPAEPQTTSLRHLAARVTRTVEACRPGAEDVAVARDWLRHIATTLGYAPAVTAAATAQPPLPARSSTQVRAEREALRAALPRQTRYPRAHGAFVSAWRRLWRTWGPELLHCYDIPALPPDNLQLEGLFGSLRRHQRRISGVASTRPLRDLTRQIYCGGVLVSKSRRRCSLLRSNRAVSFHTSSLIRTAIIPSLLAAQSVSLLEHLEHLAP